MNSPFSSSYQHHPYFRDVKNWWKSATFFATKLCNHLTSGELRLPGRAGGREGASGGSLQQLPGGEQLHSPSQAPRKW